MVGTAGPAAAQIGGNPTVGDDPNDRRLVDIGCTTGSTSSNPNFPDENSLPITLNVRRGQNSYAGGTDYSA